eukprot:TRINITY_DN7820_c0_g1_i2.p1 TRINITY_DN7820_c0_g1~~TRINITY_DN7820_c0_g1_i2.p1  ORF type:complete len:482 (+),score=202.33 TRINITY_DN7820_c0_g1_i2:70-1515(+)
MSMYFEDVCADACAPTYYEEMPPMMFGTVVLNGMQVVQCALPVPGCHDTTVVDIDKDVTVGENPRDGTPLDVLFAVPHTPAEAHAFQGTMTVLYLAHDGSMQESSVELGAIQQGGGNVHVAHHVEGVPVQMSVTVVHDLRCVVDALSLVERQLVAEVVGILENPRLNKEQGSLSSVLINNKAKESVLYDRVVGQLYNRSWSEFLRAHEEAFSVFYYSDADIRERNLAPHIKRSDARVHVAGRPARAVYAGDEARCAALRAGEEELKQFLIDTLAQGDLSQRDLLAELKHCKGFTDLLFPTSSLLMRFLTCHRDTFLWTEGADEPTRIGLVLEESEPEPSVLSEVPSEMPCVMSEDMPSEVPSELYMAPYVREPACDDINLAAYLRAPSPATTPGPASAPDLDTYQCSLEQDEECAQSLAASSEATTPGHTHSWASSQSQSEMLPLHEDCADDSAACFERVPTNVSYRHDPYSGGFVYEQVA